MLLDSQYMDYSVELQKDKQDCNAPVGAYCTEIELSPWWKNVKEDSEGLG
jgi:hypothetical protein